MSREEAIRLVASSLKETDVVVSTTGKTSRELFELREEQNQGHNRDFLTVGSMGHSSSIALGIALAQPERDVYCFDGDGGLIMHMGSLATIGKLHPSNFRHIVFNNFSHESVGGQPTAADVMDIPEIAKASGYQACYSATTEAEVKQWLEVLQNTAGPSLLEIRVDISSRSDLGRPTKTPQENKEALMSFLKQP
jgi:phosphonopyruvate decarboxylase